MAGQNILTDSFSNADVSQFNWIYGTSRSGALPPILTARSSSTASPGGLPGGGTDTAGTGALRLTTNAINQGSFAIYNKAINASAGLSVQFKLYSYGGTGADGISFFLIDGSKSPTTGGAVGGSLGYSSDSTTGTTVPGIDGGYLGVGFDEYGNFSVNGYGTGGNANRTAQSIAVRGSQANGYPLLTSTGALPNGSTIDNRTATTRTAAGVGRLVDIELDPTGNLSVSFDLNGDGTLTPNETVISNYSVAQNNGALPSTFKFGFAASTGAQTNFHEVNNLAISTFSGAYTPLLQLPTTPRVIKPNGSFDLTASIDVATTQPVTIPLTFGGTALQGTDYQASANSITIAPGQTTGSVTITGLNNSPTVGDKTIQIATGTPTNNVVGVSPNSTLNVTLSRMSGNDCVIPDFNGDLKVDLPWRNVSTGENAIWLINGTQPTSTQFVNPLNDRSNWKIAATRDFNGDGKTDYLWRNTATGENAVWLMDGTNFLSAQYIPAITDQNWQVVAARDFSGDGTADILWRNATTGENAIWLINGTTVIATDYLPTTPIAWKVADVADFNNDGKADLVWRNTTTGEDALWLINGTKILNAQYISQVPDQNWQIVAARDTSGDGNADLVWRNTSTGEIAIWLMNGVTPTSQQFLPTPLSTWQIADVCDLNSDGKADLIWRNTATGENGVWLLNGTTATTVRFIPGVADQNWKIVAARDTSGDGKADLIWRNGVTGEDAIWLMDGATTVSQQYLATVSDPNWQIQIRPNALAL